MNTLTKFFFLQAPLNINRRPSAGSVGWARELEKVKESLNYYESLNRASIMPMEW
jgi:hypothetical protein